MTLPIISGTMTVLRRWVRMASGFSLLAAAVRLAERSFLMRVSDLRWRPRWKLWSGRGRGREEAVEVERKRERG